MELLLAILGGLAAVACIYGSAICCRSACRCCCCHDSSEAYQQPYAVRNTLLNFCCSCAARQWRAAFCSALFFINFKRIVYMILKLGELNVGALDRKVAQLWCICCLHKVLHDKNLRNRKVKLVRAPRSTCHTYTQRYRLSEYVNLSL